MMFGVWELLYFFDFLDNKYQLNLNKKLIIK